MAKKHAVAGKDKLSSAGRTLGRKGGRISAKKRKKKKRK